MSDEVFKKLSEIELQLRAERMEILSYLRDEKERHLLVMMLENNVQSARRMRNYRELAIGRMLQDESKDEVITGCVDLHKAELEHIEKHQSNVTDITVSPFGQPVEYREQPNEVEGRQPVYDEMDCM